MKLKSMSQIMAILLLPAVVFIACKKGDTGPAGVQGPAGTANVQYSTWNKLNMTYSNTDSLYEQTITADSLTQGILDSGIVLSYIKFVDASNQTNIVNASTYMEIYYSPAKISLYSPYDFTNLYFRYVVVPGGVVVGRTASANSIGYTKEEWERMSYEEVIKILGKQ